MLTLDKLPARTRAVVVNVGGEGVDRSRLMALGVVPGAELTAEFTAPLGDPRAYRVRGCLVALRRSQAAVVAVRPSDDPQ